MQAQEFLEKHLYGILWQWGATTSIGNYSYLWLIEMGLMMIYAHQGKLMSWMIRSEAVVNPDCNMLKFYTKQPIVGVPTFRRGTKEEIEQILAKCQECDTECEPTDCCTTLDVSNTCCCDDYTTIDMTMVGPASILSNGQYKISWGDFSGGLFGRKVEAKLCQQDCQCIQNGEGIFITYFWRFNKLNNLTDQIPLPDAYMPILALFVASLATMRLQNYRAGDDVLFQAVWLELLKNVSKLDNNIPKKLILANGKEFYFWI